MKKNAWILILFLLIGWVAGTIVGQLLSPVKALQFLTESVYLTWEPKADLDIIKYDFHLQVKLNLIGIIGLIGAFSVYRKL
jgi:hypothetical protein